MPDFDDSKFEWQHIRNLKKAERALRRMYEDAIQEVVIAFSQISYNGGVFRIKDYPILRERIKQQLGKLHQSIYSLLINSIEEAWNLSNAKNDVFVDRRLAGKKPSKKAAQILYDPNEAALNSFIRNKDDVSLSDRVWNSLDVYQTEMETALGMGISDGRPAAEMATELKKYLRDPERLFRRVRNAKGELKLSKAAREFHPGQGVYRSSYQNALRLTATTTNAAYRNADIERWRHMPFVIAFQINLSPSHPKYDICDELAGIYPLTFNWTAWHPRCLCYLTAVQISDEEYEKYEDSILGLGEAPEIKKLLEVPEKFKRYVKKNRKRIKRWSNQPYWLKDNRELAESLLK